VLSSHTREAKKGGCLTEVNISTKLMFWNILFGCLRQVGCLIEVTANTGLTVSSKLNIKDHQKAFWVSALLAGSVQKIVKVFNFQI